MEYEKTDCNSRYKKCKCRGDTASPIPGIGRGRISVCRLNKEVQHDDIHAFEKVVKKFVAEAKKNLPYPRHSVIFTAHTPSYNLTVDSEKCEKLGVNISDVFTTMQAYMGSLYINDFTLYNRTYHVVVQADTFTGH